MNYRIGHGIDVHPFTPNRPLVLGGVTIPHDKGLAGHSDADALVHALCDALLGAAGLADIGHWFPNTDERYRNIRSLLLLEQVMALVAKEGYAVGNVDITVLAEAPKLAPYLDAMKKTLAPLLRIQPSALGIKATTTESLGFVGRKEGIEAHCVCLLVGE